MQPISTSRWPWTGSRPVVSVSKTISRMEPSDRSAAENHCAATASSQPPRESPHLRARRLNSLRRIHHKIGPPALFRVRHLPRQQPFQLFQVDAALQTRARCISAGADTTTTASTRLSPPVSNSSGISSTTTLAPAASASVEELLLGLAHQRMHDRFEPLQRRRIAGDPLAERCAIDLAVSGVPGNAASIAATASPS